MQTTEPTQWANAGLSPSHEAMRDHLLIGLLQEGRLCRRIIPCG